MNLQIECDRFQAAWRMLTQRWNDAVATWDDPERYKFEGEFWVPLMEQTPGTVIQMHRLVDVITQVQQNVH